MKHKRIITSFLAVLSFAGMAYCQTADEIVDNYINAIGGREVLSKITSLKMHNTMDAMGTPITGTITILNGKGYKMEIDIMGSQMVTCYTDSMGWSINPMGGSGFAESMPPEQYKMGRDNIYVAGQLEDHAEKGYKLELLGQEAIGTVNAFKLKITNPDSIEGTYYFDPKTHYLLQMVQEADMMGQPMEIVTDFSNYQKTDLGYVLPYTYDINYGGQFQVTSKIDSLEFNIPVDPEIFIMK
jgi:hypothetical protein